MMLIQLYKHSLIKRLKLLMATYKRFHLDMKIITDLEIEELFFIYENDSVLSIDDTEGKSAMMLSDREVFIFSLFTNLCTRKGKKQKAVLNVIKCFRFLRSFFWINALALLQLIVIRSESLFTLQRYMRGKREVIIPRFISFRKKTRVVLRMVVRYARETQRQYRYFYLSLAHAILEYSVPENTLFKKNIEDNQLARANRYRLFRKRKRKRKKVRLLRMVRHWRND
jgi:ribosomal protein S7